MKKLVLGFVIAVSLMMGLAGAAGAAKPDDNACNGLIGGPASTVLLDVVAFASDCEDHSP